MCGCVDWCIYEYKKDIIHSILMYSIYLNQVLFLLLLIFMYVLLYKYRIFLYPFLQGYVYIIYMGERETDYTLYISDVIRFRIKYQLKLDFHNKIFYTYKNVSFM